MAPKRKATQIRDKQQQPCISESLGFINFHCDSPQQVMTQPASSTTSRAPFAFSSSTFPTATGRLSTVTTAAAADSAGPDAKKIKKGGSLRVSGSRNFRDIDKKRAFAVIRKILPYGNNMWEQVARQYSKEAKKHGRKERDAEFLKSFFMEKVKEGNAKPTRSRGMSWDVAEACGIQAEIEGNIHMGSLNDATIESASEWEEDKDGDDDDDDREDPDDAEDDGLENDSEIQQISRLNSCTVFYPPGASSDSLSFLITVLYTKFLSSRCRKPMRPGA
ncbi:hypothetical protein BZA77DRAFT_134922 [Pyronema omphalodes]|nr:hypothetical protein BZA77DRAFT_134922 [Pyronema omphalodes]